MAMTILGHIDVNVFISQLVNWLILLQTLFSIFCSLIVGYRVLYQWNLQVFLVACKILSTLSGCLKLDHVMTGSCDPEGDEMRTKLSRKEKEIEVRPAELIKMKTKMDQHLEKWEEACKQLNQAKTKKQE